MLVAVYGPSLLAKLLRRKEAAAAFRTLGFGRATSLLLWSTLLAESAVLCGFAVAHDYAVIAGGALLVAFGVVGWMVLSRQTTVSGVECGCLGGLGQLVLTRSTGAITALIGLVIVTIGLDAALSGPPGPSLHEWLVAAGGGLAAASVYWTTHYVVSARNRMRLVYEGIVR
jgi:hypothetical protein